MPKKDTTLDFGFVQVPIRVLPAAEDDELDLRSLCHGKPPKLSIKCQEGGEEYTSWQKVPERGYEWTRGEYITLTPEELAAANEQRSKVDSMKVEKTVDFQKTATTYVFEKAYYVLPPEKSNETSRASYRAVYEVIRDNGRAVLCRFAPGNKVRHYAVIADAEGSLIAYEIRPRKPLPYEIPQAAADTKTKAQAKMLLESGYTEDLSFPAEPDPLFELIQKKLAEKTMIPGVGETILIPK